MPQISKFYGIKIRMFWETGGQHHHPHLHASYQNHTATYRLDTADLLVGSLPRRQHRLVVAWIEIHQEQLLENWQLAQNHQPINKIPPLN